jgi:hypothetical protein
MAPSMHTPCLAAPLIRQKRLTVERLGAAVLRRLETLSLGRTSR